MIETNRNRMARGLGSKVDASSLQCCATQATLAQYQLYVAKHRIDKESTVKEVLVIYTLTSHVFFYHKRSRHVSS